MRLRALIVGDRRKPGVREGVERALPMLRRRLRVVGVDLEGRRDLSRTRADVVVVFGGDGSILQVAHRLGRRKVPVLGVNYGRLGWLAELPPEDLEKGIDALAEGRYRVAERTRLLWRLNRTGRSVAEGLALNDVVVGRRALGRMTEVDVRVDGLGALTVAGDGLIVATSSGSTAHALAAGGPLLVPGLDALVLVPICPHALGGRPLVVPRASRIDLIPRGNGPRAAVFTVDGRPARPLAEGEVLEIRNAYAPLRVVSVTGRSYYDLLREKLGWQGRPEYGPAAAHRRRGGRRA